LLLIERVLLPCQSGQERHSRTEQQAEVALATTPGSLVGETPHCTPVSFNATVMPILDEM
jgi:hypothetical protein